MNTGNVNNGVCLALMLLAAAMLCGCASLLPDSSKMAAKPWKTYDEARQVFGQIVPGKTSVARLQELGVDAASTPNVTVLSHADLLRRLQAVVQFEGPGLDPALRQCVAAREDCYAYRIEEQSTERERTGHFWVDFLDFRRTTEVTGWQFDALIMISRGVVIYTSWSGKPHVSETEHEHHPLGPLQGLGSSLIH